MRSRFILTLGALAAIATCANAQSVAWFESQTNFGISYGGDAAGSITSSVTSTQYGGPIDATGDGQNLYYSTSANYDPGTMSGFCYAQGESTATHGQADEFLGAAFFFTFTNTSTFAAGSYTVSESNWHAMGASGNYSSTTSYGGTYRDNYLDFGWYTTTLNWDGSSSVDAQGNFADSGGSIPPTYYEVTGSMTYLLAPGETSTVEVWASGETHAAVPEPATMSLCAAGLGLLARRRRKSN